MGFILDKRENEINKINLNINYKEGMPLIVLNGTGGVGKDEFVKCLSKFVKVYNYSTIDYYKEVAKECFDWNGKKDEKGRKLLSDLKLAGVTYNNAPIKDLKLIYTDVNKMQLAEIFICMCRDIDEIKKIQNNFSDVITVLLTNDRVPQITSNIADKNVFNMKYDVVIENNGTIEDLENSAETFLKKCLLNKELEGEDGEDNGN